MGELVFGAIAWVTVFAEMVDINLTSDKWNVASQRSLAESLHLERDGLECQLDPGQFVATLRDGFLQRGYKLNGMIPRDSDREARIDQFVRQSPLVARAETIPDKSGSFREAATRLLRCFERLCYRTQTRITDDHFRSSVYEHLIRQLARNVEFFRFDPAVLVTATLMSRESLPEIAGADLMREPGNLRTLLYRAFACYPQSIDRFFSRGKERLGELETLLSESGKTMARSFQILYAFFQVTLPVDELMQRHFALVDEMIAEDAFANLSRSLIESVVGRCKPQGVRGELQRIVKESHDLLGDPEVRAVFGTRAHHVRYVVSAHAENAKEYLLRAAVQEERLSALYGALGERFSRKELRDLCVKNPTGAKSLEERLELRLTGGHAAASEDSALPTWML